MSTPKNKANKGIRTGLGYYDMERLSAYIHDALKIMHLCKAGGQPRAVYGLNVEDTDSGISSDELIRFMIEAKTEYEIDLYALLDVVSSRSDIH